MDRFSVRVGPLRKRDVLIQKVSTGPDGAGFPILRYSMYATILVHTMDLIEDFDEAYLRRRRRIIQFISVAVIVVLVWGGSSLLNRRAEVSVTERRSDVIKPVTINGVTVLGTKLRTASSTENISNGDGTLSSGSSVSEFLNTNLGKDVVVATSSVEVTPALGTSPTKSGTIVLTKKEVENVILQNKIQQLTQQMNSYATSPDQKNQLAKQILDLMKQLHE